MSRQVLPAGGSSPQSRHIGGAPLLSLALMLVLVVAYGATASAGALRTGASVTIDAEEECATPLFYVPGDYRLPPVTEPAQDGTAVDVFVLVDGFPRRFAKDVVAKTQDLYSALGLAIKVTGYRNVTMQATMTAPDGKPAGEPFDLLDQMKDSVGGGVPKGADAVYLLTAKEMFIRKDSSGQAEEADRVIGMAECIGAVRFPDRSFAVGSGQGPYLADAQDVARVMAHELGHLLGAAHGHGSCGEGAAGGPSRDGSIRPCTIMHGPQVSYLVLESDSDHWSVMEKAVIQGHADEYARP